VSSVMYELSLYIPEDGIQVLIRKRPRTTLIHRSGLMDCLSVERVLTDWNCRDVTMYIRFCTMLCSPCCSETFKFSIVDTAI
jgi:hypothetical protein